MSHIDPTALQQAFVDLGIHPNDLRALLTLPLAAARNALAELKERARRNFRQRALELHPDRNGGDVARTERFKAMSAVRDDLERVEIQPIPTPPNPVVPHPRARTPFRHAHPFAPGVTVMRYVQGAAVATTIPGRVGRRPFVVIIR